jgi:hypothetical protein
LKLVPSIDVSRDNSAGEKRPARASDGFVLPREQVCDREARA